MCCSYLYHNFIYEGPREEAIEILFKNIIDYSTGLQLSAFDSRSVQLLLVKNNSYRSYSNQILLHTNKML